MQIAPKRNRFAVSEELEQEKGTPLRITRNDLDILDLLQTYKYLPSTYLIAFLPDLHPQYIKNRLTLLRHVAKVVGIPASSWHAANARYRPAVYQLTDKGHEVLKLHGRHRPHYPTSEEFKHEFGVCITEASFALGVRAHPMLRLHDHQAILNSKRCPPETRRSATPFKIPLAFTYRYEVRGQPRSKELDTFVKHDGRPFGLTNEEQPAKQMFFPGIEFDRHTESRTSSDYSTITIQKKIQEARALAAMDGYAERYGIPNAFLPFVTINEGRMHSLMDDVDHVTKGKGSRMFLFTHMPDFASFESFPPADGSMLTRKWKRVAFPDLDILHELGVH